MNIIHSRNVRAAVSAPKIATLLGTITERQLRAWVEHISVPRHFGAEPEQNRTTADWLCGVFESMGFRVHRQGGYSNIVALPKTSENFRFGPIEIDGTVSALEVVALRDLFHGLVHGVVDLLQIGTGGYVK